MADTTTSTYIGAASLALRAEDGTVGVVKSLSDADVTKIKNMITDVTSISNTISALENKITISTASPSGGTSGQLWFKYEA